LTPAEPALPLREDAYLGGRMRLLQPARGYRAGMDALLLAAAVEAAPGAELLEAGCGAGAALIAAALRLQEARFVGLEREATMASLARENLARNGLEGRVTVIEADLFAEQGAFDGVFCNPPFSEHGQGRPPAPARRHAYLTEASIDSWVRALADRLRGGAALTLIHRAERLPEILAALEGRLGGVEALPVFPRAGEAAKRVLVRARKGSRAPFRLHAGFALHEGEGHSQAAGALWAGAALAWR